MNAGILNVYLSFEIKRLYRKVCVIWKAAILFTINCCTSNFFFFYYFRNCGKEILYCILQSWFVLHFLQFRWWQPWLFKFPTGRSERSPRVMKVISILFRILSMSALHCKMPQNSTFQCLLLLNCTENSRRGWILSSKMLPGFVSKLDQQISTDLYIHMDVKVSKLA